MKKMLFIFNPHAGTKEIRGKLFDIVDTFCRAGYQITIYSTQAARDAADKTRLFAGQSDLLLCSGGDGTLSEVVSGLMSCERRPVIGYLPAGTTNDFASSLKIPRSIEQAVKNILEGVPYSCDIGELNGSFFTYVAAFGAFTNVAYGTPQIKKNFLGHIAYILEGIKQLPAIQPTHCRVTWNGGEAEGDFLFGMVSNSHSIGGLKGITGKGVVLNDGLFEVLLIRDPKNFLGMQAIAAALVRREILPEYMLAFKTDTLDLFSDHPVPWTTDGEFGGEIQQAKITNHKQAVRIMVPPDAPEVIETDRRNRG